MTASINKSSIPIDSQIFNQLSGAYYSDAYSYIEQSNKSAMEIWLLHMATIPSWINWLMKTRNNIVSRLGLKHLGHIDDIDPNKTANEYQVGDRVGFFILTMITDQEIILIDSDKHLDVQVSIFIATDGSKKVSASSVVHVHNYLGKAYMFLITPFHKIIVPATIKRAVLPPEK